MAKMEILALSGKMGVGKSEALKTLNEYLKERGSKNVVRLVKFAAPLYEIQSYIYARIGKEIPIAANGEKKDRKLLQLLGTEWGREIHGMSVWVDLWKRDVQAEADLLTQVYPKLIVVCDDCRFDNEAETVKKAGGHIVKIVSSKTGDRIQVQGAAHASENGISDTYVDMLVENNGTLEEYKAQLIYMFDKLRLAE